MTVRDTPKSFAKATVLYVLSVVVASTILALTHSAPTPFHQFGWNHYVGFWWVALGAIVVEPAIETLVIIYPTRWAAAQKSIRRYWLVCLLGGLPLALLHIYDGWTKPLAVIVAFVFSAHCYLQLRQQGVSFRQRYLFLFGIHALNNLFFLGSATLALAALHAQQRVGS